MSSSFCARPIHGPGRMHLIGLYSLYLKTNLEIRERYRRVGFYFVRIVLMVLARGLVLAYEVDKPLLAMNIGAAAPLMIRQIRRELQGEIRSLRPAAGRIPYSS